MIITRISRCFMLLGCLFLLSKGVSAQAELARQLWEELPSDLDSVAELDDDIACADNNLCHQHDDATRMLGLFREGLVDDQDMAGQYIHHEEVRDYIAQCAPNKLRTSDGYYLIHFAAAQKTTFALKLLIEKGACLNVQDRYGTTPLHIAIVRCRFDNAAELLAAGANPNISNNTLRECPLHYAIQRGQYASEEDAQRYEELCFALLEKGALPAMCNKNRVTPLHLAIRSGFFSFVGHCVNQFGMDINEIDAAGRGPIIYASECSDPEMLEFVMKLGANPKVLLKGGITQMHIAARDGLISAISFLAAKGFSVNVQDKKGYTPLHYAADKGYLHTVKALLGHGARPDVRDCKKRLPEYYIKRGQRQELVQYLKRARAKLTVATRRRAAPVVPVKQRGSASEEKDVVLKKFAREIGASVVYA